MQWLQPVRDAAAQNLGRAENEQSTGPAYGSHSPSGIDAAGSGDPATGMGPSAPAAAQTVTERKVAVGDWASVARPVEEEVHVCVCVCVCTYACVCMYVYIHAYIYIYIYIYI